MANRKTVGLIAFLKGSSNPDERMPGCANFDHHFGGCLFRTVNGERSNNSLEEEKRKCPCLVEIGNRCGYFETCVLPAAADIGLKQQVYSLYAKHVGIDEPTQLLTGEIRACPDCGGELKSRQRYCDNCTSRRRRKSYRRSRGKRNG